MPRRMSRTLMLSTLLAASLALGAAPSYADMSPSAAGISDHDWSAVGEIGAYNGAYTEYVDNSGKAVLVFTGGNVPSSLQWPSDFTGFDNANLTLYGEYSQFATNDQVDTTISNSVAQLQAAGYNASAAYDPDTDVVDVTTLAPSSVTASVVSTYGSKIHIVAANPGISASDWALVEEIGAYNGAYTEYVDSTGKATLVFTGSAPSSLQWPSDFTGFSDPTLTLWGETSQFATNAAIDTTIDDTITQIQNAGYGALSAYDPYTDKVDVTTLAPSSVTAPLVSTYAGKINVIAGDPNATSGTTDPAQGSPKKHAPKKQALKKHTRGKTAAAKNGKAKKHMPAKSFKKATPAPGEVNKVVLALPKKK
ncbi:hypothetical protein ACIRQQ_34295 [Streptomyces fuscichromogenes]|uniref:hypothetical protein n=1 Tax=Streptomyces fuscichromogenes TaxID=1324013 RepID=UPI00381FE888